MRKKRNIRGDVVIDLTSLLDVIFILLLVVLCGQQGINKNLTEKGIEQENAIAQANETREIYEDMIDMEDNIQQMVWAASIAVPYEKTEITKREIKLLVEGKEIESFPLIGNEVEESINQFREVLIEYIESNQERPVILSLNDNDDNILYRDETRVNDIMTELIETYSNVYIRGGLSEEEK